MPPPKKNRSRALTKQFPASKQRVRASRPSVSLEGPEIGYFWDDLVAIARNVQREFKDAHDGHHQRLRMSLQDFYEIYRNLLKTKDAWSQLKRDPYWETCQRKPDKLTVRDVVLFLTSAETPNDRSRAAKYAVLLAYYNKQNLRVNEIATAIAEAGGIEKALGVAAAERAGRSSAPNRKPSPKQLAAKYFDPATTVLVELRPEHRAQVINESRESSCTFIIHMDASPSDEDGWTHLRVRTISRSFNRPEDPSTGEGEEA